MTLLRNARDPSVQGERRCTCVRATRQANAFLLLCLLALGIFAEGAFGQASEADPAHSKVSGTVINAVTHDPIGRALVYSGDNRFAAFTDSEGRFEFTGPAQDAVALMARKPGFIDDLNERTRVERSQTGEFTISLMPEALITGRVILSAGEAAVGVNVQLFSRRVEQGLPRWMPGGMERANSNGEFRFAELRPGEYKLLTHEFMDNDPAVAALPGGQPYGFPPVYYTSATDFASASTIQLTSGESFHADISLSHQAYYPVRIPVTNAEGRGGMNITISPQGRRGPGYSLGYNAAKQRIEGSLPNGKYLVDARSYGTTSSVGEVNISVAGAPVEGPSMVLTSTSSIVVNVKEEFTSTNWSGSGTVSTGGRTFAMPKLRLDLDVGVESADDDLAQQSGSLRPPAGPNDNSTVLEDLVPGRYWLRARASRGYVASATMGGVDLLRQPFVVGLGATVPIEITMRDDNAEIEGTVDGITVMESTPQGMGSAGLWTPSAYIYCVPLLDSPGQFLDLSASSDGKFDYQMVAPGTYRVMAFKNRQPNLPYRDAEAMKAYESKGQVVHVSAGEKASVQLQIANSE